jgi:hypothetical protein
MFPATSLPRKNCEIAKLRNLILLSCYLKACHIFGAHPERTYKIPQFRISAIAQYVFGAPGRIRTRSNDVRSVGLFQLSYRSGTRNAELRIAQLRNLKRSDGAQRKAKDRASSRNHTIAQFRNFAIPSTLHANYLLDLCNDLNQVFLVFHHCLDRFVSAWNFIQYANVLATFNSRGLTFQILLAERSFCRAT